MTARAPEPAPAPSRSTADAVTAAAVERLAEDVWQWGLAESPVSCTYLGDHRADDRLDDHSRAARERRARAVAGFSERLAALPLLPATSSAGLTQRVLRRTLDDHAAEQVHRLWEQDVDQLFGLHLTLANLMAMQPVGTPAAVDALVARLADAPRAFADWAHDLEDGLAAGRTPPEVAVERTLTQLTAMAAAPAATSPYAAAVARLPAGWSSGDRERATARIHAAVDQHVRPAVARLRDLLATAVRPRARRQPGLGSIPGGAAAYAWRVRSMTTTDLTPERIHAIGREELETNRREILEIARAEGHTGDMRSFLDRMLADRRFRLATREEILERYRTICARMDARLPELFGRLPRTPYEIRPIEAWRENDAPAAFYQPPPLDGSRGGIFYANTRNPDTWPTYEFEALCFHEAVPGHHLQLALAQETPGLPPLRRHGGFTAYLEGWAHYTERLADEVGMYSTPYDRVGMLTAQAWRAARLVVDTGLHALGWSREQAVQLLEGVRAGSKGDVENEVDRYIVWPGQALAYKIGSRTITELRARAQTRLGARFRLKDFHDEVLRHGALPLAQLSEVLDAWSP